MDSAEQILEDALEGFRSSITDRQMERFAITTLRDVKLTIIAIQSDGEKSKSLMNFTRLSAFLDAFEQFDGVCRAMDIENPDISAFIWGPLRFILDVGVAFSCQVVSHS
jgi:hypothetical protein